MKTFSSKLFFYVKNKERKYTQISSVGAAVPRQVMKRKARNPCKKDSQTNQSAVGATDVVSVVPTGLGLSINHFKQGFRATHSTACLETIVPNGTYGCLRTMSKKTGNLGCFVCPLPVFFFAQLPTIFGNITFF